MSDVSHPTTAPQVRILVEPNAHHVLNVGDAAMLQVAVHRLYRLWPTATVEVLTESP